MPNLFPFDIDSVQAFLLVFTRVATALALMPVTGGQASPAPFKVGLAALMTAVVFPVVDTRHITVSVDVLDMGLMIAGEAMIGMVTALFVSLLFAGVQLAGAVVGFQVGFGIVNVVDPATSAQVSITSQLYNLVALLLFLALNAHLMVIAGVADSFALVPVGGFTVNMDLLDLLVQAAGAVYVTGVQVAAPLTVTLLLKQAAMGLIARTVPQINIFIVGFPLTIALGMLTIALCLPAFSLYSSRLISRLISQIDLAFHLMG